MRCGTAESRLSVMGRYWHGGGRGGWGRKANPPQSPFSKGEDKRLRRASPITANPFPL
ncbi:hypothetical protein [Lysobacter gummosus]|uniref:hypothetical protein n=1 Tax=Lysobacter gummosus TaxID=262324 RepID=UPI00363AB7B4